MQLFLSCPAWPACLAPEAKTESTAPILQNIKIHITPSVRDLRLAPLSLLPVFFFLIPFFFRS